MNPELIRTCFFRPYLKGKGPTFRLRLWDLNRRDSLGKSMLKYELSAGPIVIFAGEDFACAPGWALDSDSAVECLMGFLTLREGDTDSEYFANYSELQKTFRDTHAETLGGEVDARFCDENGNVIKH